MDAAQPQIQQHPIGDPPPDIPDAVEEEPTTRDADDDLDVLDDDWDDDWDDEDDDE